jgi:lysozyme family protein
MADAKLVIPFIRRWEGGYANHPNDRGKCTMMGITIGTYQQYFGKDKTCEDLKNISEDEWLAIFKKGYWDKMKADKIENQSLAQLCVDLC